MTAVNTLSDPHEKRPTRLNIDDRWAGREKQKTSTIDSGEERSFHMLLSIQGTHEDERRKTSKVAYTWKNEEIGDREKRTKHACQRFFEKKTERIAFKTHLSFGFCGESFFHWQI